MKNLLFLFYGFGSEYRLHNIFKKMTKFNYNCLEIDALKENNSKKIINSLVGQSIVFITSAHLLLDKKNFGDFYPNDNNFYGVLEIINLLKPIKSIYIPHDLTQPLIDYEELYINKFDLFLSPCQPFTSIYSQYVKTVEVGWVNYLNNEQQKKMIFTEKAIWFLSDFILHFKIGVEKSFNMLYPVLKQGVAIKFPNWIGCSQFEKYFLKKGINVYKSSENVINLIKNYKIIITNGLSSINAESYLLGKTTINIMEMSHYGKNMSYLNILFPKIIFFDNIIDLNLDKIKIYNMKSILKSFDMKKAISLIVR